MSQKDSGYERISGDRYFTPEWVTEALLDVEVFRSVLDPAEGDGHICRVVASRGGTAFGSDILGPDGEYGEDFLRRVESVRMDIITNPPYGKGGRLAVDFIKHALDLTRENRRKVAMLLRVDFDSANGRREIFNDHLAFAAKYALTKRIRWANLEQKASGPTENHAWFVWNWARREGEARYYGYLPIAPPADRVA